MDKTSKSPLFECGEDIGECDEQVEDNQVAIQETRKWPINKGYSSTPPSQDNYNEWMQPILRVHEEGQ